MQTLIQTHFSKRNNPLFVTLRKTQKPLQTPARERFRSWFVTLARLYASIPAPRGEKKSAGTVRCSREELTHGLDGTATGRLRDGSGTALTSKNINVYAVWDGGTAPDPRKPSWPPLNLKSQSPVLKRVGRLQPSQPLAWDASKSHLNTCS